MYKRANSHNAAGFLNRLLYLLVIKIVFYSAMKYFIKTYGCQMNKSDSERIAAVLESAGYEEAQSESDADLIVVNACSVRESAVDRIGGSFKKYEEYKKQKPHFRAILTGCVLESDKKRFEEMFDLIIGIGEIEKLLTVCSSELGQASGEIRCNKEIYLDNNYFQIRPKYKSKITAYIPITKGCNNFCSYCVVPYTRGRERSRPAEEVLEEISELISKGYKEIILLGQNVNSYESKIQDSKFQISLGLSVQSAESSKITFPKLLKLINNLDGDFWIRFLTSHPKDMTEELIRTVAECEKVTPYIHLAMQSGDDEILRKMNRKYTSSHFLSLVRTIRRYIPNVAISTDIIVGFPGETEKQFQNTAEIMRKAKFDMAYISRYSPRPGTAAAKLADDVDPQEKKRRERILTEILKETALENNKKYVGKTVDALIEKVEGNFVWGKTRNFKNLKAQIPKNDRQYDNIPCRAESSPLVGKFAKIRITEANAWNLKGELTKSNNSSRDCNLQKLKKRDLLQSLKNLTD